MFPPFTAEVFQNPFLAAGSRQVHAIITVTAGERTHTQPQSECLLGVLCDISGSMEGAKLEAAKAGLAGLVHALPDGCELLLMTGADEAHLLCPIVRAEPQSKRQALQALGQLRAFGGTRMSNWFRLALEQFGAHQARTRHMFLLTDGQNDVADDQALHAVLPRCKGAFQCDCRGLGVDWQPAQLRSVAATLLGSVDRIAFPQQITAELESFLKRSVAATVCDVSLRLWTPQAALVKVCKATHPTIVDLKARSRKISDQVHEYPLGIWKRGESREYHICVEVTPGDVGDEVLACRASLIVRNGGVESKVAEGHVLATWLDGVTEDKYSGQQSVTMDSSSGTGLR